MSEIVFMAEYLWAAELLVLTFMLGVVAGVVLRKLARKLLRELMWHSDIAKAQISSSEPELEFPLDR